MVNLPAFPPQQDVNTLIAITHPYFSDLVDPEAQWNLLIPGRPIAVRSAGDMDYIAGPSLRYPVMLFQ
jgi:hypothetical protein